MMGDLELKFSVADYHRTRPLLNGDVTLEGIRPSFHAAAPGEACLRPVYEEFDVAEMSLSWYVMARDRGEPVYALPIFPLRMFVQPYIYYRPNAGIADPRDLIGKRVGIDLYRLTVGLWARGILQEHYGVSPDEIHWFTSEPEGAGFQVPAKLKLTQANEDPEKLLLNGEIDALIAPNVPKSFRSGDKRIRRLFQRCRESIEDYFEKTKIFPITHTVVVREDLLLKEPWIAERVVHAFQEANDICRKEYEYPKRLSFPTSALILEEEERKFGKDPWAHGLEANRHILETFMDYAVSQGYTGRRLDIGDAFWPKSALSAGSKETHPSLVGAI
jgi:4,5-dihydroxyphthalate decarboxylase